MSSESPAVRSVLGSLAKKVREMPKRKDSAASVITTDTPATGVTIIARAGAGSEYVLSGQHIGNALWGLRNCTSSHEEVRDALGALAEKISESSAELNGQNIGNALYSLHAMSDHVPEVRQVLAALAHKLVLSSGSLSGLDIGMALYGLRDMDSNIPEVRVILGALIHKIRTSDSQLKLRDLSLAIVGVLKASPWVRDDFLSVLASKTPGMTYLPSPITAEDADFSNLNGVDSDADNNNDKEV
jgi:hypothetical protein